MNSPELNSLFNKCETAMKSSSRDPNALKMFTEQPKDVSCPKVLEEEVTPPKHIKTERMMYPSSPVSPPTNMTSHASPESLSNVDVIIEEVASNLSILPTWKDVEERPRIRYSRAPLRVCKKGTWVSRHNTPPEQIQPSTSKIRLLWRIIYLSTIVNASQHNMST